MTVGEPKRYSLREFTDAPQSKLAAHEQAPRFKRATPHSNWLSLWQPHQRDCARPWLQQERCLPRDLPQRRPADGYDAQFVLQKAKRLIARSRVAAAIEAKIWQVVDHYLRCAHSSEQITDKLAISHEAMYRHIYPNKKPGYLVMVLPARGGAESACQAMIERLKLIAHRSRR